MVFINKICYVNKHMNCVICLEPYVNQCQTNCHHEFCKICLDNWIISRKISCPICRTKIRYYLFNGEIYEIIIYRKIII